MNFQTELISDQDLITQLHGFATSLDGKLRPTAEVTFHLGIKSDGKSLNGSVKIPTEGLLKSAFASSDAFSIEQASLILRPKSHNNSNEDVTLRLLNKVSHFSASLDFGNGQIAAPEEALQIAARLLKFFPKAIISPLLDGHVESLVSDLQHTRDAISAKTEQTGTPIKI